MPYAPFDRAGRAGLALAASLCVFAVPAGALRAQRATLEPITHQQTLPNGLQVIVVENHDVPIATAEIVVRGGAITQEPDDQGVPHLYEHMLFKGYRGMNDRSFQSEAARMQAYYNGTTSDERVTYFLTLPSKNVDDAVHLLADMVRSPHFEKKDLTMERFVVLGEYQRNFSEPRFLLARAVDQALWGDAFYRKNTIGEQVPLLSVTPTHLDSIFHRYYVPNNAALIVTGDVQAPSVFEMAARRFGGWKRGADPFTAHPVPPMPPLAKSQAVVVEGDVADVTLTIAWQGPSAGEDTDGTYDADVLSDLLSDPDGGFQKRLVDGGLFESIGFSYQTLAHTGPITLRGVTRLDQLPAALTALELELRTMPNPDYFSAHDLAAAKKRRQVAAALDLEAGTELAHELSDWWAVTGLDYYLGYVDALATRSNADIRRFVTRYLTGKPFVIGALVPAGRGQAVSEMLTQYIQMAAEQ